MNPLDELEDLLVQELIDRIKRGEAKPADLNVARQYLKEKADAKFTNPNVKAPALAELMADLPFPNK